jgi:hypothetical protein
VNNGAAMERISHPEAKEAFEILKSISATAQERKEAERRIRYVDSPLGFRTGGIS